MYTLPITSEDRRRRELRRLAQAALDCYQFLARGPEPVACAGCKLPAVCWGAGVRRGSHCAAHRAEYHAVVEPPFICCESYYDPHREYEWREKQPDADPQPQDALQ